MIENTILGNILVNENFCRKVLPYINESYFDEYYTKKVFSVVSEYIEKYNERPSFEALKITIDNKKDLSEAQYDEAVKLIKELEKTVPEKNEDWLLDETESFCRNKALYNSIRSAIHILDGQDKKNEIGAVPKMLQDALSISFDTNVGHDYLEDSDLRFAYYHKTETRIPFDIEILNRITRGGLPLKTLTVLAGTTGAGKSLVKCHMAAANLLHGKNVLYITMELAEEEIGRRIDANILDTKVQDLEEMPKTTYDKRISRFKDKTTGKLIIKEYPTGSVNAAHFRYLLNELRMKKKFVPDVIYIDYLNLCTSSRIKGSATGDSYTVVKAIAEEIRGLAMEFNVAIVTSTQLNRGSYGSSDVGLENTSESMGLPHTADVFLGLIATEETDKMGQILVKQLKNRLSDVSTDRRFALGMDKSKMRCYDVEQSAQDAIAQDVNDTTSKPSEDNRKRINKARKSKIEGLS